MEKSWTWNEPAPCITPCQLILRTIPPRIEHRGKKVGEKNFSTSLRFLLPPFFFPPSRAISRIQLRTDQRDMWSTRRKRRRDGNERANLSLPEKLSAISSHGRAIFLDFLSFFLFFIVRLITISPFVISISHSYVEIQSRRVFQRRLQTFPSSHRSFIEFEGPPLVRGTYLSSRYARAYVISKATRRDFKRGTLSRDRDRATRATI